MSISFQTRYTSSMISNRNQSGSTASRARNRHNNKVSRYSESFHWPGRSDIKPRAISSSHLSSSNREFRAGSSGFNDYDPYSRLNFRVNNGGMRLTTAEERKRLGERMLMQRVALGLLALAIALTAIGMMWMQHSNNAAQASELVKASQTISN